MIWNYWSMKGSMELYFTKTKIPSSKIETLAKQVDRTESELSSRLGKYKNYERINAIIEHLETGQPHTCEYLKEGATYHLARVVDLNTINRGYLRLEPGVDMQKCLSCGEETPLILELILPEGKDDPQPSANSLDYFKAGLLTIHCNKINYVMYARYDVSSEFFERDPLKFRRVKPTLSCLNKLQNAHL